MGEVVCGFKLSALKYITVNLGRDFERPIKVFVMLTGQLGGQVPSYFFRVKLLHWILTLYRQHLEFEFEIFCLLVLNCEYLIIILRAQNET